MSSKSHNYHNNHHKENQRNYSCPFLRPFVHTHFLRLQSIHRQPNKGNAKWRFPLLQLRKMREKFGPSDGRSVCCYAIMKYEMCLIIITKATIGYKSQRNIYSWSLILISFSSALCGWWFPASLSLGTAPLFDYCMIGFVTIVSVSYLQAIVFFVITTIHSGWILRYESLDYDFANINNSRFALTHHHHNHGAS